MILTGNEIKKQIEKKRIHINPFCEENINPNSYNYRLGDELLEVEGSEIDVRVPVRYKKVKLTTKGFIIRPSKIYLGHTFEEIGSDYYLTILIGRSSIGRLGLFLQITADLGHVGSKHKWTLELHSVQPVKIYPGMKIGQVSFWEAKGSHKVDYNGKYQRYSVPYISKINEEFK